MFGFLKKKSNVYEDEFMEVQKGLISLCLEVVEHKAVKVYLHCSIENKSRAFNAFVETKDGIKTLNELGVDANLVFQLLRTGTNDLEKIIEVCKKYDKPAPTEIKLIYDIVAGKLDAQYQYKPVACFETGKSAGEVFMEWVEVCKKQ